MHVPKAYPTEKIDFAPEQILNLNEQRVNEIIKSLSKNMNTNIRNRKKN